MSTVPPGDVLAQLQSSEEARQKTEQALQKATERITELQAELQSFAYAAGHDLREPLRTIGAYSQLLQNLCKESPDSADFIRFIKEAIASANHLIERLLTFSRAGSSIVRSPMHLGTVVQVALYSLSGPIGKSGAIVQYDDLHEASVNDSDLKLVFESLIDNAIKYRGENAPSIEIKTEERSTELLVIVRDHGPGIEPEFRQQVFLPFKRLHGKEIPGAGLGLAICRKIIKAHGGEIWVQEGSGGGAEFCFTLPY